jgi:hypothetical protein
MLLTAMVWVDKRHIYILNAPQEEGSFMDEHGNTITPDIAGCYMCTGYASNRVMKQPKAI